MVYCCRYYIMMIFKITIFVSIIKLCVGDTQPISVQPLNLAVSSQSFMRQDVPLSYKYGAVHVYTTLKPDRNRHKPITPPQHRPEIQYAPISIINGLTVKNVDWTVKEDDSRKKSSKKPLQPNPNEKPTEFSRPNQLTFVPGYNIEILQSVDRYPGRNAVYRSYPNMPPNEKLNKVNHLNQFLFYEKLKQKQEAAKRLYPKNFIIYKRPHSLVENYSKSKPESTTTIEDNKTKEEDNDMNADNARNGVITEFHAMNALSKLPPHPKTHRMLLNIARAYKIANNPRMALVNKPGSSNIKNSLSNTHLILHLPSGKDQKTKLYSIQNRYQYPGYIHL